MSNREMSVPRLIAIRYISIRSHSHLVSFMSAISIFGLSIGVGILITAMSIMNGFDTEMRENILGVVPHITLSTDENLELQEWENIAGSVSELSEVNGISPVINVGGVVETESGNSGVLVAGINPQMEENVSVIGKFFVNGELENLNDTRWGIVIGQSLAGQLKVNVGESVNLFSPSIDINPLAPRATFRQFEVVGIFKVGNQQIDNNLVIANIESIRALFKMRQNYNGLRLRTRDVLKVAETEGRLSDLVPEQILITAWTTQFGAIYENIKFSRSIISLMLWLLIMVAAFNLIVSLIMIVKGKASDIAILRALGASPSVIRSIFLWQGGLIGSIGIFLGVILGLFGSSQIGSLASYLETLFSVSLLNPDVYPLDSLPSQISVYDVGKLVIGVFGLAILATIYPSSHAASIPPAQSLRSK